MTRRSLLGSSLAALAGCGGSGPQAASRPESPREKETVTIIEFDDAGLVQREATVDKVNRSEEEWKRILPRDTFLVARKKGTETAFTGRFWNNHRPGIYRCACCGTALFNSEEKFESGTGWPSFTAPLAKENIRIETDRTLGMTREEVLCNRCDAHLGHVFEDGPAPSHMRYCMNSAALDFHPRAR